MIPRTLARRLHTTARAHALTKFLMPAMSPTMTEGGIASWKKKEGETFTAGDVLLEIETDKATMDVEAQDDGIMAKIIKPDGSKEVQVGTAIAILGEEGDDLAGADKLADEAGKEAPAGKADEGAEKPASPQEKQPQQVEEAKKPEPEQEKESKPSPPPKKETETVEFDKGGIIFASPIAKRMALERGIPLGQVKGSGPNGRILKADVENFKPSAATTTAGAPAPTPAPSTPGAPAPAPPAAPADAEYTDIPLSGMRRTIGKRLVEAKQTVPHYYLTIEIGMDKVLKLREVFNSAAAAAPQEGKAGKLSVNDFIVKAVSLALAEVPEANSSWMGESIRQYKRADVSIAVATPNGLITPIVKDVGSKGLATISAETKALAKKARDGKLQPQEYQGGTFTISNLGMYDIQVFSAIINPPQSCILAVGSTSPKLVPAPEEEKGFKVVQVMQATLSADHRTVDGAVGARWLAAFKRYMENPLTFML